MFKRERQREGERKRELLPGRVSQSCPGWLMDSLCNPGKP